MKKLLSLILTIATFTSAAEDLRDASGKLTGTKQTVRGTETVRDAGGKIVGTKKDGIVRDASGKIVATEKKP